MHLNKSLPFFVFHHGVVTYPVLKLFVYRWPISFCRCNVSVKSSYISMSTATFHQSKHVIRSKPMYLFAKSLSFVDELLKTNSVLSLDNMKEATQQGAVAVPKRILKADLRNSAGHWHVNSKGGKRVEHLSYWGLYFLCENNLSVKVICFTDVWLL